ncbi:PPIases accelerate the folding of proteins. It catalyzes the cis-trans isomerization of proline imidic peptide bonds in oligopeptides (By similarity) [Seminavis robusta]|uniref:PPIases accelerate the folding of proteins. It catalyzes the cis-trans isomerization of proline imidic peptide bonds in oligopeptides By similarity n=1 Tax=Seminavis robusta TaxID=568900 RepID=A0A9N8I0K7_9STRA|nr:PPIases accelerate the folding of proteins. It catalyzes the cis-trans isomerization of proline imidic peptide bonds in oligopeptides (By similarity) [Seminavis robusta]|eukprot:Sro2748_g336180.1 PPIases accelerate the folding of proteins. It catalyzes the cis-trans isomerization of proline imidic peptide bonds in oligopeptides (By similarity) (273) ;mRNA; f:9157-9975
MTTESGVNRRRGQAANKRVLINPQGLLLVILVAGGVLTALVGSTAFSKISDDHSLGPSSTVATTTTTTPKGTSLVDCTVQTPINNGTSTTTGVMHITVRHDLSPSASNIFIKLVEARHFDGVFVFRVLKHFVAQFGVRHEGMETLPAMDPKPTVKDKDDVHDQTLSNVRGTLSFAGGNPGTTQVFVNLGDNTRLDKENSRPFATVDDQAMMQILDQLYTGYKDGMGQVKTMKLGESAMKQQFPNMSQIQQCRVVIKAETVITTSTTTARIKA